MTGVSLGLIPKDRVIQERFIGGRQDETNGYQSAPGWPDVVGKGKFFQDEPHEGVTATNRISRAEKRLLIALAGVCVHPTVTRILHAALQSPSQMRQGRLAVDLIFEDTCRGAQKTN